MSKCPACTRVIQWFALIEASHLDEGCELVEAEGLPGPASHDLRKHAGVEAVVPAHGQDLGQRRHANVVPSGRVAAAVAVAEGGGVDICAVD